MATPNAELAYKVLDHIDTRPDQLRQDEWIRETSCGTVACFAGWTVLLSGAVPDYSPELPAQAASVMYQGDWWPVSGLARELLGSDCVVDEGTYDEVGLFDGHHTREDLHELVADIFGPRPATTA